MILHVQIRPEAYVGPLWVDSTQGDVFLYHPKRPVQYFNRKWADRRPIEKTQRLHCDLLQDLLYCAGNWKLKLGIRFSKRLGIDRLEI